MSHRLRNQRGTLEAGRVRPSRLTARRLLLATLITVFLGVVAIGAGFTCTGYRVWVVHTGSMEPTLMPGDIVVDAPARDGYRPGQIITFLHSDLTSDVVTHRIKDVLPNGDINTKGDANRSADIWDIRPDQVQGRVIHTVKWVGYLLVFLRQPTGIAAVVAVSVSIILLWQLFFAEPTPRTRRKRRPGRTGTDRITRTCRLISARKMQQIASCEAIRKSHARLP